MHDIDTASNMLLGHYIHFFEKGYPSELGAKENIFFETRKFLGRQGDTADLMHNIDMPSIIEMWYYITVIKKYKPSEH